MVQPEHQESATATLRTIREQAADYDPVDKLLQLQRDLLALEHRYGLSSEQFYRRYQAGEMGDDVEIIGWAGRYRVFMELRSSIANGLNQVAVLSIPVTA